MTLHTMKNIPIHHKWKIGRNAFVIMCRWVAVIKWKANTQIKRKNRARDGNEMPTHRKGERALIEKECFGALRIFGSGELRML